MRNYVIALYIRLSVEDFKTESLSIPNQKLILREKAMSLPEWDDSEILEFIDNGHTGTNFERPAVQELLTMVQAGKINCIIVKDLSRFGRNSIETGYFIERVFPLYHTRFISVSDDFDTANFKGDTGGIDIAFKYLISEWYSRDMSMKTKSAKYAKMRRGEYQSVICPYQEHPNYRGLFSFLLSGIMLLCKLPHILPPDGTHYLYHWSRRVDLHSHRSSGMVSLPFPTSSVVHPSIF